MLAQVFCNLALESKAAMLEGQVILAFLGIAVSCVCFMMVFSMPSIHCRYGRIAGGQE